MFFQQKIRLGIQLIIFTLGVLIFVPMAVQAQEVLNPCWTKADCESVKDSQGKPMGIWGKDISKDSGGTSGCELDGGRESGGQCEGGKSRKVDTKTGLEFCQKINNQDTAKCYAKPPEIKLQVPVPGMPQTFSGGLSQYLATFYRFFVGAIAVMAVVMVMWGGFKRIYGAGSPERIKDANDTIVSAISGLVIALLSYTLLQLVNPKLVDLPGFAIEMPKKQGFGEMPKKQGFGDWCGSEIKDSTDKPISCGVIYKDPNSDYKCRGSRCDKECVGGTNAGKFCAKDEDCLVYLPPPAPPGQKDIILSGKCQSLRGCNIKEYSGDTLKYTCLTPKQACEVFTVDILAKITNIREQTGNIDKIYNQQCIKMEKDGNKCRYKTAGSTFNHCKFYAKSDVDTICAQYPSCDSMNSMDDRDMRIDFCRMDLCNRGCKYKPDICS